MIYRALADLVVLLHAAFVVFVVAGGLLALRWRRAPWVHIPCAVWGALIEFAGWICPLTPLENALRHLAGHARGRHRGRPRSSRSSRGGRVAASLAHWKP